MASVLPIIPLQTLLDRDKLRPLVIGFKIPLDNPTWAVCYLIDHTNAPESPTYRVVRTEDHSDAAALKAGRCLIQNPHIARDTETFLETWANLVAIPSHLIIDIGSSWLAKGKPDIVFVVVSTLSGTEQAPKFYESILKPLLNEFDVVEDHQFSLEVTNSPETIRTLVEAQIFLGGLEGKPIQNIILLSGDGGISDIVNGILKSDPYPNGCGKTWGAPVINLIPMGTGNALANSSGILGPADKPKPIPIFRVDFRHGARFVSNEGTENILDLLHDRPHIFGAVVCSWGLHATLVADSDTQEYRRHGDERFAMVAKNLLNPEDGSGPHSYKGRLTLFRRTLNGKHIYDDQFVLPGEHGYLLATFCSKLDANFMVSPQSQPLDGRLMLVRFGPQNDAQEIWRLLRNGQGLLEGDPTITYREVDNLLLKFDEEDDKWRRVCVDGTIVQVENGGTMQLTKYIEGVILQLRVMKED